MHAQNVSPVSAAATVAAAAPAVYTSVGRILLLYVNTRVLRVSTRVDVVHTRGRHRKHTEHETTAEHTCTHFASFFAVFFSLKSQHPTCGEIRQKHEFGTHYPTKTHRHEVKQRYPSSLKTAPDRHLSIVDTQGKHAQLISPLPAPLAEMLLCCVASSTFASRDWFCSSNFLIFDRALRAYDLSWSSVDSFLPAPSGDAATS